MYNIAQEPMKRQRGDPFTTTDIRKFRSSLASTARLPAPARLADSIWPCRRHACIAVSNQFGIQR